MSNHQEPPKSPLSALDHWRNICDALITEGLLDDDFPENFPEKLLKETPASLAEAVSIKLELAHLARPDESPEEHISRLERELEKLSAWKNFEEINCYQEKIREMRKAAHRPPTRSRTSNI
jgi:hypothetical protein